MLKLTLKIGQILFQNFFPQKIGELELPFFSPQKSFDCVEIVFICLKNTKILPTRKTPVQLK
jgi:hypothetical protein